MDWEFHYYITYLTALAAGIPIYNAYIIAHSAQFVDDNLVGYKILNSKNRYENTVATQSINTFDFSSKSEHIWQKLHFIPGEYKNAALRKDGRLHEKCVTSNSPKSIQLLESAIESKDPYKIGIASHAYADTWAHQNFVGHKSTFNNINWQSKCRILASIGHADALNKPDIINLIWHDKRLLQEVIYNKKRFLDAAQHLYHIFCNKYTYINPRCKAEEFIQDIDWAIDKEYKGNFACINSKTINRIKKYHQLAYKYSNHPIPSYNSKSWVEQSIKIESIGNYRWQRNYQNSHFYKFNQAAKYILNS